MKFVTDNDKLSTREIILDAIKRSNQATVDDLAQAADVSPVTVRHHLNSLQAEGLLKTESIRRKVGRPYYIYSLSEKGQELFPKRYVRLSSRLLDELKARFPADMVNELFNAAVENIVNDHREDFENRSFEGKLSFLVKLLGEEGFLASWEETDEGYALTEYSCPYISVGQRHGEVCTFDKQLITLILETEVTQHSCMLQGDTCCQFTVIVPEEVN